jgi:hypothetical protein
VAAAEYSVWRQRRKEPTDDTVQQLRSRGVRSVFLETNEFTLEKIVTWPTYVQSEGRLSYLTINT